MTAALIVLLLALAGAAVWPFWREAQKPPPDLSAAPGRIARLAQGRTHYQWRGPSRAPVIVAVHGIATASPVFDALAERLVEGGYRVLTYDLWGRGFSDAPPGAQDAAFFLRQLEELLADQGIAEDVTLLGYSMGGAIATAFAAAHPEMMKRLILLAPAGMAVSEDILTRRCREWPAIGDWLHLVTAPARIRATAASAPAAIAGRMTADLGRRGFLPALLSSRRNLLMVRQEAEHRAIGRADIPVVAIWGETDAVIPLRALGLLASWNRAAKQEVVTGAGHGLPYTHAAEVASLLRAIFREDWV